MTICTVVDEKSVLQIPIPLCINFHTNFRDLPEIQSRALDNVGRVYAVMGDFTNATK